ncbi:MAG TPA: polysaccharide export protein EpsE [Limnobacter sp.]|uniref:polysaccharide export protein EpsE n=1 Tax=Limnobacter sp. TaxID=2003368 RepID=UPI002EDA86CC
MFKSIISAGLLWLCVLGAVPGMAQAGEDNPDYRLGGGDLIHISVFQNPDFSGDRRVAESGEITVPLVGPVMVGNLTIRQAEEKVAQMLSDGKFVVRPQVAIVPLQMRSAQVSVIGLVGKPGRYQLDSLNMRVTDALSMAGGIVQSAPTVGLNGGDVVILKGQRNGRPFSKTIDLADIFLKGQDDEDVPVVGGDTLYVARAPQYYVYGEVQKPGTYKIERRMTVRQALAQAGGLTPRGSQNGIRIYRKGDNGQEVELSAELDEALQDNDTLYFKQSVF